MEGVAGSTIASPHIGAPFALPERRAVVALAHDDQGLAERASEFEVGGGDDAGEVDSEQEFALRGEFEHLPIAVPGDEEVAVHVGAHAVGVHSAAAIELLEVHEQFLVRHQAALGVDGELPDLVGDDGPVLVECFRQIQRLFIGRNLDSVGAAEHAQPHGLHGLGDSRSLRVEEGGGSRAHPQVSIAHQRGGGVVLPGDVNSPGLVGHGQVVGLDHAGVRAEDSAGGLGAGRALLDLQHAIVGGVRGQGPAAGSRGGQKSESVEGGDGILEEFLLRDLGARVRNLAQRRARALTAPDKVGGEDVAELVHGGGFDPRSELRRIQGEKRLRSGNLDGRCHKSTGSNRGLRDCQANLNR
ncbi:hypothetical protein Mapa_009808 [Marchantia paleacea]|nr:hypothetical protein Mapa_009808 [Marchantia paleacea]